MDEICERRTWWEISVARDEGREPQAMPHLFKSRKRTLVDGVWSEWSTPKCSWCGKERPEG